MFIFVQIRTMEHQTVQVPYVTCPLCSTSGHVQIDIKQRYTWVLAPMTPGLKYGVAGCTHCGQLIPNVKWTQELDTAYKQAKKSIKTPLRLWRGSFLFLCIIAAFIAFLVIAVKISSTRQHNRETTYNAVARDPQPGDIYQVLEGGSMYTYFLVSGTRKGDTIYLHRYKDLSADDEYWKKHPAPDPQEFSKQTVPISLHMLTKPDDKPFLMNLDNPYRDQLILMGVIRNHQLYKAF